MSERTTFDRDDGRSCLGVGGKVDSKGKRTYLLRDHSGTSGVDNHPSWPGVEVPSRVGSIVVKRPFAPSGSTPGLSVYFLLSPGPGTVRPRTGRDVPPRPSRTLDDAPVVDLGPDRGSEVFLALAPGREEGPSLLAPQTSQRVCPPAHLTSS